MADAYIHAKSSAKRFGGQPEDYLEIHQKMDCSKAYMPDNRHRALTHTMFWVKEVMIPIYGVKFNNSDGKEVLVKDICEQHILEDFNFRYIPTPQDFLQEMEYKDWMQNGIMGIPTSVERIERKRKEKQIKIENTLSD
jgi:hypothetical protein